MDIQKMMGQERRERTIDIVLAGLWLVFIFAIAMTSMTWYLLVLGGVSLGIRIQRALMCSRILLYMETVSKQEGVIEYLVGKIEGVPGPGVQMIELMHQPSKKDMS
mgnify:CR=1 FL=1